MLGIGGDGGGLRASFEYGTGLFDRSTIARLAGHFTGLLATAAEAPQRLLSSLPVATAAERQQLLPTRTGTTRRPHRRSPRARGLRRAGAAQPRRPGRSALAAQATAC